MGRPTTPSELVVNASFRGSTADVDEDMKAVWHLRGVAGELRIDSAADGACLRVDVEKHLLKDKRISLGANTIVLMLNLLIVVSCMSGFLKISDDRMIDVIPWR